MKPLFALTLAIAAALTCHSQTVAPPGDSARILSLPAAINAVLGDFPYNLRHVTGELLLAEGEVEHYASLVVISDAEKCLVMRYHSMEDSSASWQAQMFSGADFDAASKKYRQLFGLLSSCCVRMPDSSLYFLAGNCSPAREEVGFTTSVLRLKTDDERFRHVKVELELDYRVTNWTISINILSKVDEDTAGIIGR